MDAPTLRTFLDHLEKSFFILPDYIVVDVKELSGDEDVRKVVCGQLLSDQKDFIDGTWEDGTISKVNLTDNMLANESKEVNSIV